MENRVLHFESHATFLQSHLLAIIKSEVKE